MTCEDTPVRVTWEIELYEPFSRVWMSRGYGRATTSAAPVDLARAVLAGYLAGSPARAGETFRAIVRTDTGGEAVVTAAELADGGWEAGPDVRRALPGYLRDALTAADGTPRTP